MIEASGQERQGRYGAWLYMLVFGCAAVVSYVGPLGLAPTAGIGGLLALPLLRINRQAAIGAGLLLALALWAAVSMTWSRDMPNLAIHRYGDLEKLTGVKLILEALVFSALAIGASRLTAKGAEMALRVLAFAMTLLAALVIVDGLAKAQIYQAMEAMIGQPIRPDLALRNVAQAGYILALMVWPAATLLRREGRNVLVLALVAGVIGSLVLFSTDAPTAAMIVGLLAFVGVLLFGRAALAALGGLSAVYLLGAPWIVRAAVAAGLVDRLKAHLPDSWDARLDIWSFAAARIAERPLRGWGLDASRTWPGVIPLHTHDGALQLWLELGLPGVLLAAAFVAFLFWSLARAKEGRGYAAVGAATLCAYLTIGAMSFGIWQEWWLGAGAIAFCACMSLKRALPLWAFEHSQTFAAPEPYKTS